ncbi:MAG: FAD-dependent oxidoreductase, partial [Erysipelotrichaceae bacterium]|nr:FAD-dependent oxidoreductase [Erysipelotrichaceae bacterium]
MRYDIGIIGAGPGGYTAALQAAKEGLSVILFEKDKVGGTCLNRGCIPTKSLLHSSSQFVIGKSLVPELLFDWNRALERKNETVTRLRTDIEKLIKARKVTLVNGHACIESEHVISCEDEKYEVENIIIATG